MFKFYHLPKLYIGFKWQAQVTVAQAILSLSPACKQKNGEAVYRGIKVSQ